MGTERHGTLWHGIGTAWYRRDMMGDVRSSGMYYVWMVLWLSGPRVLFRSFFTPLGGSWRFLEALEHKNLRCRAVEGKHCLIDEMVVADIQTYGV